MIIYKITNTITDKVYIGQTIGTLGRRWYLHKRNSKDIKNKFYNAIRRYGTECWIVEIIEEVDNINLLNEREEYWITYYDTFKNGYNSRTGGGQRTFLSDEAKELISKNHANFSGVNNPNFGKKHTKEAKEKISLVKKGKKNLKHSERMKGLNNPNANKCWVNNKVIQKMIQIKELEGYLNEGYNRGMLVNYKKKRK